MTSDEMLNFCFKVTIYFRNRLYRGNRVAKIDCEDLNAFESYNFPTLAEFRTKIQGMKLICIDS